MTGAGSPGNSAEDPLLKRLHEQQESLKRLQAMPSPKESARQADMDKAGFLKQRLESLKAMLLYASPKQLKAIAEEIKAIAKELTSIAKSLGGGGNGHGGGGPAAHGGDGAAVAREATVEAGTPNAALPDHVQAVESDVDVAAADAAHAMARQAETGMVDAGAALPTTGPDREATHRTDGAPGSASANDSALRALLQDARKALQEVVSQLKSKLTEADKEARRDTVEAERRLDELDVALARPHGDNVYTSLGSLLTLSADATASLPTIDISV